MANDDPASASGPIPEPTASAPSQSGRWLSSRVVFQIDAFGVHCPQTGETYLVPIGEISSRATVAYLRIAPTKNGQKRRVRQARNFVIGRAAGAGDLVIS